MLPKLQINYPDPGFWTQTSLIQLGYGVWVNLAMLTVGLSLGFSAVAIPQLRLPESRIKVTISDEAWITSIPPLFSPLGCLICGYMIDKYGRRIMLIFSQVPVFVGWFVIGISDSAVKMIIGRMISGFGMGMVMSVPWAYMTEMSLPNMRGVIGSFPNIAISIGITIQAGLGSIWEWTILCHVSGVLSILLVFLNIFLPETPYYLIQNSLIEEARKSLKKFRGKDYNVDGEMDDIIDFKNDNNIHRLTVSELLGALLTRSSYKPFVIITIFIIIQQFSGSSIIILWAVDILQRSNSTVNADIGAFILGVTRIIAGIVVAALIFNLKRRTIAIYSALGVGVIAVALGLLIRYMSQPTILPQLGFMIYIIFMTFGYYTLPTLIMFELYPLQVRGLLGGISVMNINLLIFIVNKCYPYVRNAIGSANTVLSCGICSLLGAIYLYFCLPETKDLTLQEIEEYFNERRSTLISQRRLASMMALNEASRSHINITDKKQNTTK